MSLRFLQNGKHTMLENLKYFLIVARTGSFSLAASELFVAVSSVTRKITSLETELKVKLFRRGPRGVMLTDAGEQFLTSAQNVIAELEQAKDTLSNGQIEPRGLLTIAAPSSFGRRHIAPAVTSFLKKFPEIEIDLYLSDQVIDLSVQRIDVAIRIGALPDSDLVATQLAPMIRMVCASPDYISEFGRPKKPEDLLKHNCLIEKTPSNIKTGWSFPELNSGRTLPLKGSFRSDDKEALLQGAIDGVGIVHLPSWLVWDKIQNGSLIPLFSKPSVNEGKSAAAIHAVRLPGRSHATKAQLFTTHLKQEFGEPAYWDTGQ